jgi:hypothetical protein
MILHLMKQSCALRRDVKNQIVFLSKTLAKYLFDSTIATYSVRILSHVKRTHNFSFIFESDEKASLVIMDSLFWLNVVLGVIAAIYLFLRKKTQYWELRNVPFVKPELFYGNARGISKKYHSSEFVRNMYSQLKPLGPVGGVYMYTRTAALAMNLDLIKSILIKDFNVFTNRGSYSNEKDDPLSAHLVKFTYLL